MAHPLHPLHSLQSLRSLSLRGLRATRAVAGVALLGAAALAHADGVSALQQFVTEVKRDFTLKALPAANGLDWVQATPRRNDSGLQSLKLGFKGRELSALEIVDGFGQQSVMQFSAVEPNAKVSAERFRFTLRDA